MPFIRLVKGECSSLGQNPKFEPKSYKTGSKL